MWSYWVRIYNVNIEVVSMSDDEFTNLYNLPLRYMGTGNVIRTELYQKRNKSQVS